jgi:dehydrogenase/reductase SDR family protein 12
MARYVDAIDLPLPIKEAFDYLADFSRTAQWDPGVTEARRISRGPVKLGSRFEVVVSFLGRKLPLEYRITEFERPHRLVLSGGDDALLSVNEITFVSRPGGTRVTYEARIELGGVRRLAEPVVHLMFQQVGRVAVRGLRERIEAEQSQGKPKPEAGSRRGTPSTTSPHTRKTVARGSGKASNNKNAINKKKGVTS